MTPDPGERSRRRYVVGERLRRRRRELGLTQHDLALRLATFGVPSTNKALSGLERGVGLDVAKLPELARALDCTVTYLLGLTEEPQAWEPDADLLPEPKVATLHNLPTILGPDIPDLRAGAR